MSRNLHAVLAVAVAILSAVAPARGLAVEAIRVAFIDPLSGPFANTGHSTLKHFQGAVDREQVVRQLGGRRIVIVPFDNKAGVVESITQLRRAIDMGIRHVIQGQSSAVALALVDAIEKHNARDPGRSVLFLNYAALDPELTNAKCSFWHFRFDASVDMRMKALVDAKGGEMARQAYYLVNQDYSFGRSVAQSARDQLGKVLPQGRIVGEVLHPLGTVKDFSPYIARVKSAGANAIITGNWGTDLALLVKAARETGFEGHFLTFFASAPGTVTAIGQAGAGRISQVNEWHPNIGPNDEKLLAAYAASFRRTYGEEFRYMRILTLIDMLAVALQMHPAGNPRDVATALEGMRIRTPTGVATMRAEDHQLLQPLYVSTLYPAARNGGLSGVQHDTEGTGMDSGRTGASRPQPRPSTAPAG